MALIVQKFGGSSVANAQRVRNVASIITDTYKQGNDVVAVVSAQGDTTDDLIEKAAEINPKASKREMDSLLSAGYDFSASSKVKGPWWAAYRSASTRRRAGPPGRAASSGPGSSPGPPSPFRMHMSS